MARLADLPRTRATLLDLRRSLSEARDGHALLERKREVLLREVWDLMRAVGQHEGNVRDAFASAHAALREARLDAGSDAIRSALLAPSAQASCHIGVRSLMGVSIPNVDLEIRPERLTTSAGGTPSSLDATRLRWMKVLETLEVWAEVYASVWRVAAELARTQRRVRSLEEVVIPEHEDAIQAIETALDEAEREEFVRAKRVKAFLDTERTEERHA